MHMAAVAWFIFLSGSRPRSHSRLRAGQYLTLRISGAGQPTPVRSYSLSSEGCRPSARGAQHPGRLPSLVAGSDAAAVPLQLGGMVKDIIEAARPTDQGNEHHAWH
jgi:hypothetical protein